MSRYAQGGDLTQFNEGGTHEQNALGGVPIGNNNSVEQGETKQNNFIYSNRIFLNKDIVAQYNLPKSLVGKSVADATKLIDSKFKGRNDKISQSTKDSMLSKIAEAQEAMKPQEPEMEQSQQDIESQSQMQQPQQFADGGIAEDGSPISLGAGLGIATSALDLGNVAFGRPSQDTSGLSASADVNQGGMIASGAMKGAMAGSTLGPLGAAVGGVVGAGAGLFGAGKAKKAALENSNNYARKQNSLMSDQYGSGGELLNTSLKSPADTLMSFSGKGALPGSTMKTIGDKRKETDLIKIPSNINKGEVNYVRATTSKDKPVTRNNALEKQVSTDFNDWYLNPATADKFQKNTGMDPARLKDFVGKAQRTPMVEYKAERDKNNYLSPDHNAEFRSPNVVNDLYDKTHAKTGYISYHPQQEDIPQVGYTAPKMRNVLGHEMAHASGLDATLAPALSRALQQEKGGEGYINVPEETYGNFHEFRLNLGLKPGQQVDRATLEKMVQEKGQETNNFYKNFSTDKQGQKTDAELDKIVNAINTVADNGNTKDNRNYAAYGGPMKQMATGGKISPVDNYLKPAGLTSMNGATLPENINLDIKNPVEVNDSLGRKIGEGLKTAGNYVNDNAGNIARYAPIAANALQLSQLKKPNGERLDRLSNRYKSEYVDEAALQNIANNSMNNTINSIGESGASQGQMRASILGSQLQRTKALSDSYSQAAAQNRATNDRAQQFNLGVDQTNLQQSNSELDINDRNQAAYRNEKSKYISALGNDIGEVGKEQVYKSLIAKSTGYKWDGEYVKSPDGNVVNDPDTGKPMTQEKLQEYQSSKTKKALGGYLIKNRK